MAQKKNEIIEEQRRAREEFLRLKKMQHGEIEPEAKPSEVAIRPHTFSEKLQNYWYHFKVHTILIAATIGIIAVLITQCATRERFDFEVLYFTYTPVIDAQLDSVEEYFEKIATDVNGDDKVNVQVINCSVSDDDRDAGRNVMFSKVQSIIVANQSTLLYMVDDKAIDYFENALGTSIFVEEPITLGQDFYSKAVNKELPLPDGLKLGLRIIKGTTFDGNETAQKTHNECEKVLEIIKKQNG